MELGRYAARIRYALMTAFMCAIVFNGYDYFDQSNFEITVFLGVPATN